MHRRRIQPSRSSGASPWRRSSSSCSWKCTFLHAGSTCTAKRSRKPASTRWPHPSRAIATARALVNDLKAGAIVEGGSTITQQLAKNQYFTQEQTVERKIAEVFMALTMEQHFSKRTILELYVNSIYFGDGYEGIGSAS